MLEANSARHERLYELPIPGKDIEWEPLHPDGGETGSCGTAAVQDQCIRPANRGAQLPSAVVPARAIGKTEIGVLIERLDQVVEVIGSVAVIVGKKQTYSPRASRRPAAAGAMPQLLCRRKRSK